MADKRCPKCGKKFKEDWTLCSECGVELVVYSEETVKDKSELSVFFGRAKDKFRAVDRKLDRQVDKVTEVAEGTVVTVGGAGKKAGKKVAKVSKDVSKKARVVEAKSRSLRRRIMRRGASDDFMKSILDHPVLTIIIIASISMGIAAAGVPTMVNNIRGEMEVYLPQDDETAKILAEVNEDWTTDLVMIYVETGNAFLGEGDFGLDKTNVTDISVLNEMSDFEESLDPDKDPYTDDNNNDGNPDEDGVTFMLSLSTLVKEMNSAPPRVVDAFTDEFNLREVDLPNEDQYQYEIPDDQDRVDDYIAQVPPDLIKMLAQDTTEPQDGIWDSTVIIFGLTRGQDYTEIMGVIKNLLKRFTKDGIIEGKAHCVMTATGPVPVTVDLTERTYNEMQTVLPVAIGLIFLVLLVFHRTVKIVFITGLPILCSVGVTFGLIGLMQRAFPSTWIITPQVVIIGPVLLALGVAYGLYICNRYAEERKIKDRKERIFVAYKTTGLAVKLSAWTTAIGFSSLMFVGMAPLTVVGFGLTSGILVCWIVSILLVPSLIMLLNYEKKWKPRSAEKIGTAPIKFGKLILLVAIIMLIISVSMVGSIRANMNVVDMAPNDMPSIVKYIEYSEALGGGAAGMVLITGDPERGNSHQGYKGSMKDVEVLHDIDDLESELQTIENVNPPVSIVTIMRLIRIPEGALDQIPFEEIPSLGITNLEERLSEFENKTFWNAIETAETLTFLNQALYQVYDKYSYDMLINIFYNSITIESRTFLVSLDYAKSLVYVDMKIMDADETERAVDEVNYVIKTHEVAKHTSQLTGVAAVAVAVNELLIVSSYQSLALSLILVFIVLILIFRSLRYAGLTIIPIVVVVSYEPLMLRMTGFDLNLVTAMIGAMIVGIGVDFGIHITARIREHGESLASIRKAVETSGFSFTEATITVLAGLSAIFLINIPAIWEFTALIMLMIVLSVIAALLILPSVYTILNLEEIEQEKIGEEPTVVEPEYIFES